MPNPTLRQYFLAHPEVAQMWSVYNDDEILDKRIGSCEKAWWYCEKYKCHYEKSIYTKINNPEKCSVCNGSTVFSGYNDLETVRPDIAKEWSPDNAFSPREVKYTSAKKVKWVCQINKNHTWETRISHRTYANSGCPECSMEKFKPPEAPRIRDTEDDMLKFFQCSDDGEINPKIISPTPATWQCDRNHVWKVSPRFFKGCPFCKGESIIYNGTTYPLPKISLTEHPKALALYSTDNELPPHLLSYNSKRKVKWECANGHVWVAYVYAVVNSTRKGMHCCPKCANQVSGPEEDLLNTIKKISDSTLMANNREILGGREIDILIPSMNLGVEFNGGIWHSSFKIDKNYHFDKWFDCLIRNVELVTVWEDDWDLKRDQIEHMLKIRLTVQSNLPPTTHIQETSRTEAERFSKPYTVHNIPETATAFISAVSGSEIVAALSIQETSTSFRIVHQSFKYPQEHGLSEILDHLTEKAKQKNLPSIEAITDNSSLDQNVFAQHGFIRKEVIEPKVTYLYRNQRFFKQELETLLASGVGPRISYDPESDSFENMTEENRIFEVWDSGSTLWTLDT